MRLMSLTNIVFACTLATVEYIFSSIRLVNCFICLHFMRLKIVKTCLGQREKGVERGIQTDRERTPDIKISLMRNHYGVNEFQQRTCKEHFCNCPMPWKPWSGRGLWSGGWGETTLQIPSQPVVPTGWIWIPIRWQVSISKCLLEVIFNQISSDLWHKQSEDTFKHFCN